MTRAPWNDFQRLLFAARGGKLSFRSTNSNKRSRKQELRLLRCFPLHSKHIRLDAISKYKPCDFHHHLCQGIRSAERRVHLASLYIGPGADPIASPHEVALLDALRTTRCKNVKVLLDRNRALRPVPLVWSKKDSKENPPTITSAEACYQAVTGKGGDNHHVYLLSVLPRWLQTALPNPLNEIAGVFHLKVYLIDDDVIISGANLSEEYFTDRVDRYLWIQQGGNGLVDWYGELIQALIQYAVPYEPTSPSNPSSSQTQLNHERLPNRQLIESLTRILTVATTINKSDHDAVLQNQQRDPEIVAYAVPTFQAPLHFYKNPSIIPSRPRQQEIPMDELVLESFLLEAAAQERLPQQTFPRCYYDIRLASAYLNPTRELQSILSRFSNIHFLTAGRISHGFKPKKGKSASSNKRAQWIPAIFDTLARKSFRRLVHKDGNSRGLARLCFYQRQGWTFHAKGLWLTRTEEEEALQNRHTSCNSDVSSSSLALDVNQSTRSLLAVTNGSSNYGARSAVRDMESNVLLLFPPATSDTGAKPSLLQQAFCEEWNQFCAHASTEEPQQRLPWSLRVAIPWIQSFF